MVRFFKLLMTIFSMTLGIVLGAQAQQVGDMIDAAMTAESALPKLHTISPEDQKAAMDDAVKMALAKIPDIKNESAVKTDGGMTVNEASIPIVKNTIGMGANSDENAPLFKDENPAVKLKKEATGNLWWRMWGSLAVVLVLIGGGAYAFRRWPGSKKITNRGRMIEVLAQHHMGPKRSIAVVRVAGETCLIGITDNNISILKTLSLLDDDVPLTKDYSTPEKISEGLAARFQKTLAAKFTKSPEASSRMEATVNQKGAPEVAISNDKPAYYTRTAKKAEASEDDFTMQGLREIVGEKLKTMREL